MNLTSPTRSALAFLMAAALAFLGSAVLVKAGRGLPQLTGGQAAAGQPAPLLAIVILLGACGVLLLAMAGKELLDQHRHGPSAR